MPIGADNRQADKRLANDNWENHRIGNETQKSRYQAVVSVESAYSPVGAGYLNGVGDDGGLSNSASYR